MHHINWVQNNTRQTKHVKFALQENYPVTRWL